MFNRLKPAMTSLLSVLVISTASLIILFSVGALLFWVLGSITDCNMYAVFAALATPTKFILIMVPFVMIYFWVIGTKKVTIPEGHMGQGTVGGEITPGLSFTAGHHTLPAWFFTTGKSFLDVDAIIFPIVDHAYTFAGTARDSKKMILEYVISGMIRFRDPVKAAYMIKGMKAVSRSAFTTSSGKEIKSGEELTGIDAFFYNLGVVSSAREAFSRVTFNNYDDKEVQPFLVNGRRFDIDSDKITIEFLERLHDTEQFDYAVFRNSMVLHNAEHDIIYHQVVIEDIQSPGGKLENDISRGVLAEHMMSRLALAYKDHTVAISKTKEEPMTIQEFRLMWIMYTDAMGQNGENLYLFEGNMKGLEGLSPAVLANAANLIGGSKKKKP